METFAYVYKWTHIPTMKYYIGSRTAQGCHPNDGYMCSSKIVKPMIQSTPEEWMKTIVAIGLPEEMYELETAILQMFDAKNDPRSFNKSNNEHPRGNTSGMKDKKHSDKTKLQMSLSAKQYCADPEVIRHRSESRKGSNNPSYGKPGTFLGKSHTEQTKKILSDKRKLVVGWNHTEETKQKMSEWQTGVAKPRFTCVHCGQNIGGQSNYSQHLKRKHA